MFIYFLEINGSYMQLLTKSKYMSGLQCPQYLWMLFNAKNQIPEPDAATQFSFDQGNEVGNIAKQWFPDGIDLSEADFMPNIKKTKQLIKKKKIIFEAGIKAGNLYSRADILIPVGVGKWDIIEVKSSTSVKEEHYHDLSFQKFCYEKAGITIRKCFLMHINNEFIKHGDIDPKEILIQEDVTDEVKEAMKGNVYWGGVVFAEMPKYEPAKKIGGIEIPIVDQTPSPHIRQVTQWLKKRN